MAKALSWATFLQQHASANVSIASIKIFQNLATGSRLQAPQATVVKAKPSLLGTEVLPILLDLLHASGDLTERALALLLLQERTCTMKVVLIQREFCEFWPSLQGFKSPSS